MRMNSFSTSRFVQRAQVANGLRVSQSGQRLLCSFFSLTNNLYCGSHFFPGIAVLSAGPRMVGGMAVWPGPRRARRPPGMAVLIMSPPPRITRICGPVFRLKVSDVRPADAKDARIIRRSILQSKCSGKESLSNEVKEGEKNERATEQTRRQKEIPSKMICRKM